MDKMIEDKKFLSNDAIQYYENAIFNDFFPWYFNKKTTYDLEDSNDVILKNNFVEKFQFTHNFYKNNEIVSDYFVDFIPIIEKFCNNNKININSLLRMKANMTLPHDSGGIAPAHVDFPFPHKVMIYYFNTTDGNTIIYKEKFSKDIKINRLTQQTLSSPEAGKAIIFNGLNYHSPTWPKNDVRVILNVAFL